MLRLLCLLELVLQILDKLLAHVSRLVISLAILLGRLFDCGFCLFELFLSLLGRSLCFGEFLLSLRCFPSLVLKFGLEIGDLRCELVDFRFLFRVLLRRFVTCRLLLGFGLLKLGLVRRNKLIEFSLV